MMDATFLRRVQRVRHELRRREVQVASVQAVSSGFAAITFQGESLADFISASFDDHVKFMFAGADGEIVKRDYTPRRFDLERRELTIEFALHGHGRAAQWARDVQPGQAATIGGPRGSMIIPSDYDWHLLAGDGSALPAIHRRIEELPAGTRAIVLLQMPDTADRRETVGAAQVEWHWCEDDAKWLTALGDLILPEGDGHVWCAGEASVMAQARRIVLNEKCHLQTHTKIAAYWKRGASEFHEELSRDDLDR